MAGYVPQPDLHPPTRSYESRRFRLRSELPKQCLGRFEIGRVKTLGETIKDRREQLVRLFTPTSAPPHPREAGRGAELPGQRALPARPVEGLPEVILGHCGRTWSVLQQNKLALDVQQLGDASAWSTAASPTATCPVPAKPSASAQRNAESRKSASHSATHRVSHSASARPKRSR